MIFKKKAESDDPRTRKSKDHKTADERDGTTKKKGGKK